jgi:hypothetical protein
MVTPLIGSSSDAAADQYPIIPHALGADTRAPNLVVSVPELSSLSNQAVVSSLNQISVDRHDMVMFRQEHSTQNLVDHCFRLDFSKLMLLGKRLLVH